MNLKWSPYLAVGVASIDDLNIQIFSRFNRLLDALSNGNEKKELTELMAFLSSDVVGQLDNEDKVIDRYDYPEAGIHKAEHARFLADVRVFSQRFASTGANRALGVDVAKRLGDWLQSHVGRTDQDLRPFLRVAMSTRKVA